MIQLNLLPKVKLEYIKAQRTRRIVISVSILVCIISVALLFLLFSYDLLQKKHLSDLDKDIKTEVSQLQAKPGINQILTVQNQLESLTTLHSGKPAVSQLFNYVNEVTPAQADISDLTVDFTKQSISITGSADNLSSVNQYIDTLKLTTYKTNKNSSATKAFNSVVLSNFGLSSTASSGKPATFTITLNYDPNIFDITQSAVLSVPNTTTTRLEVSSPSDLFAPGANKTSTQGGQ